MNAFGLISGTDRPLGAAGATVWFDDRARRLVMVHAGDTTAWRWDEDSLAPLTRDHGVGKTLARHVGVGLDSVFDSDTHSIEPGDWIVLATDGVTKGLPRADQIATILAEAGDPQHAAREMTRRARLAGSGDDITALVVWSSWTGELACQPRSTVASRWHDHPDHSRRVLPRSPCPRRLRDRRERAR